MNMDREIVDLYVDDIIPNRFQPREIFDEKALNELSISIKEHGVIQPIIVRKIGDKYEIIAGERRYKASVMAGLTKIPAIIRNLDDKESSKIALLENLQRKDLTAIEEARTYQKILDLDSMTQEELGKTMGKSQAAIANKLRLLSLPDEVQEALLTAKISERHARSLLNIKDKQQQIKMLNKIISTRMTVRELENEIKRLTDSEAPSSNEDPGSQKVIDSTSVEETPYIPDMNPLVRPYESVSNIDLNELKANTADIIDPTKPPVDLTELLKVDQKEAKETDVLHHDENTYKFIPPFDENEEEEQIVQPQETEVSPQQITEELVQSNPDSGTQKKPLTVLDLLENTPIFYEESEQEQTTSTGPLNELPEVIKENPINIDDIENLELEKNVPLEQLSNQTEQQKYASPTNTESLLNEFRQKTGQQSVTYAEPINTSQVLVEQTKTSEEFEPKTMDLKTVINSVRELVSKFERSGVIIDVEELDFEKTYQINLKIDKNQ